MRVDTSTPDIGHTSAMSAIASSDRIQLKAAIGGPVAGVAMLRACTAHLRAGQPGLILKALGQPLRPRWVGAFGPEMTSNLWYASGVALGATTMFQSCMESLTELWLACGTEEGK